MFNLLKSDFYRLVRRGDFWVFTAVLVVGISACAALLSWVASPDFAVMVNERAADNAGLTAAEQVEAQADLDESMAEMAPLNDKAMDSLTHTWAQAFLTGGMLGVLGTALAALFLVSDFDHGFIKNLLMSRRGRRIYFAEKLVFIALIQAIMLGLCASVTTASFAVAGFTYEVVGTPGELALWLGLAWLLSCAYAFIAAVVTWLTRSKWLGTVLAVMVSTGVTGAVVAGLCSGFAPALPWLGTVPPWLLHSCTQLLGNSASTLLAADTGLPVPGLPIWGHVLLVGGLWAAMCVAVTMAVCRKRDI